MTFYEYINGDLSRSSEIFEFYLNFLSELSSKKFPYEEQIKIQGSAIRFLNCIYQISFISNEERERYLQLTDRLINAIHYSERIDNVIKARLSVYSHKKKIYKIQDLFQELYTLTLYHINESSKRIVSYDNLKLNGFYQPEVSNKNRIRDLINEAIICIKDDSLLTEKSKNQLIDYLNKAISELNENHTDWSRFIGRLKEVVIVLGAVGSIVGGIAPLLQAKDKLEEATMVIQQTSISLNYNVINETFNSPNALPIGSLNSSLMQIKECNDKKED